MHKWWCFAKKRKSCFLVAIEPRDLLWNNIWMPLLPHSCVIKKIMDKLEAKKGQNMGKEFEVRKQSRKFQSFFIAYRKLNFWQIFIKLGFLKAYLSGSHNFNPKLNKNTRINISISLTISPSNLPTELLKIILMVNLLWLDSTSKALYLCMEIIIYLISNILKLKMVRFSFYFFLNL